MEAFRTGWDFVQSEVLGMKWLSRLIGSALDSAGLDTAGRIGGSVQFFLYDTIKIMVLLGVLILIISYIQSYFPPERTKKILGRFHGMAALVVNEQVVSMGRVLKRADVEALLRKTES